MGWGGGKRGREASISPEGSRPAARMNGHHTHRNSRHAAQASIPTVETRVSSHAQVLSLSSLNILAKP